MTVSWDGYKFTECRDYGHAWSFQGVSVERASPMRYVRILKCLRCETVRKDLIRSSGERDGRYDYPEDYSLEPVTPADRRRLRLHNVKAAPKRRLRRAV